MALIKCPQCGKEFPDVVIVCPSCGFNPFVENTEVAPVSQISQTSRLVVKKKNKIIAGFLCFILWPLGVHEFYLGNIKKGLLCLSAGIILFILSSITPIASGLSTLISFILAVKIFAMPDQEFDGKYNSPNSPRSKVGCLITVVILVSLLLLFISIMLALTLPYSDFVKKFHDEEKSASAIGVALVDRITSSQQRHYLRVDNFAANFDDLDIDLVDKDGNAVKSGNSFSTKDFTISMKSSSDGAYVEAARNGGDSNYAIRKYYMSNKMQCIPGDGPENESACKDIGMNEK